MVRHGSLVALIHTPRYCRLSTVATSYVRMNTNTCLEQKYKLKSLIKCFDTVQSIFVQLKSPAIISLCHLSTQGTVYILEVTNASKVRLCITQSAVILEKQQCKLIELG